jgi:hypothetical protein
MIRNWIVGVRASVHRNISVCGVKVSIVAFQAIDPGSIPGKRIDHLMIIQYFTFFLFFISKLEN